MFWNTVSTFRHFILNDYVNPLLALWCVLYRTPETEEKPYIPQKSCGTEIALMFLTAVWYLSWECVWYLALPCAPKPPSAQQIHNTISKFTFCAQLNLVTTHCNSEVFKLPQFGRNAEWATVEKSNLWFRYRGRKLHRLVHS